MQRDRVLVLAFSMSACLAIAPAAARPSAKSDPQFHDWFESLEQPGSHARCCSIADCHVTAFRTTAEGYEVPIDDKWVKVPPDRVLDRVDNPTGHAVVCYTVPTNIMCFVRATES